MQFRTVVPLPKLENPISYESDLLLLGSCFAENMASKFEYFKFSKVCNPFGIIFNPLSLEKIIWRIVEKKEFTEDDLFFYDETWHCFEVHSKLSHPNKVQMLVNLNRIVKDMHTFLQHSTHCILTFGTAWVYRHLETKQIVANCHKVPNKQFIKEIVSPENILKSMERSLALVTIINPKTTFIITISPVRHLKDGFTDNQRSKAHLITAIQFLIQQQKYNTFYFPSYEIIMDELRDYRFYETDMLHPNKQAIAYIWEQFKTACILLTEENFMKEVAEIQTALAHRPTGIITQKHQKFIEKTQKQIIDLTYRKPNIKF